ncbi:50S ribosomal protein L9 [Novispirillum itersonii]|uniref:50S ribosomal protein L9 n=1 Tax=Novispirillum itersonii TaxID=189 RepID=UPI000376C7A6|nr:50S ribosomal protein L9 [Novispirillum itersonii]
MEVILLERVEKLGQMGEVVRVKSGYARNYLLPQKKALRANKDNMAVFERQRAELEALNLKRRQEAEGVAGQMSGVRVVLVRQASEGGQLYGSVTARDIQEALKDAGYKIERRQVELNSPIKSLGSYTVRLSLHPEVAIEAGVIVARSMAEAEEQHAAEEYFEEPAEDDVEGEYEATEE